MLVHTHLPEIDNCQVPESAGENDFRKYFVATNLRITGENFDLPLYASFRMRLTPDGC